MYRAVISRPEIRDSEEYQEIGIMLPLRQASLFLHCKPYNRYQVITVKLPVHILESVEERVCVIEYLLVLHPCAEVGRIDEHEPVAHKVVCKTG